VRGLVVRPIGSASVAYVHKARLIGASGDVAVKVQHPGSHELMMTIGDR
jgi:aarF domain-containing kinase